jgi:phage-related baseplate assembly protein
MMKIILLALTLLSSLAVHAEDINVLPAQEVTVTLSKKEKDEICLNNVAEAAKAVMFNTEKDAQIFKISFQVLPKFTKKTWSMDVIGVDEQDKKVTSTYRAKASRTFPCEVEKVDIRK